jgi:hypothetical protein
MTGMGDPSGTARVGRGTVKRVGVREFVGVRDMRSTGSMGSMEGRGRRGQGTHLSLGAETRVEEEEEEVRRRRSRSSLNGFRAAAVTPTRASPLVPPPP